MEKEKIQFEKKDLVKKSEDFSNWYTQVILKSGLADYAPVRGCQIILPYGFKLWENIVKVLDKMIKDLGVENVYFPLFIPETSLEKEKKHLKGFSPELAVVTIGGGEELTEKLIVRPTSETIMYESFSRWINSWRDLPFLVNQWANVVRWEKRPRLFLRTSEFLWQEGHTAHATHKESLNMARKALKMYIELYRDYFAMEGIWGEKSENEKFAGALTTFTLELLMPSGFALQGATSHDLGQNFAKVFDIKFKGRDKKEHFVWQTSWGLSTRSIGALVMSHGDDQGLIIPPKLAPIQIVIIPIFKGKTIDKKVLKYSQEINQVLEKNFQVKLDDRKEYSVGWKFNEWELKGVPLRIEIGEKELQKKTITLVRRDTFEKKEMSGESKNLIKNLEKELDSIQKNLLKKNRLFLRTHTVEVSDYSQFKRAIEEKKGFVKAFWCERSDCEKAIKEETKATVRCLPHNSPQKKGRECIRCHRKAWREWVFARAY